MAEENGKAFRSDAYNHFYEMESPHGLNLELLQSAFQKEHPPGAGAGKR